MRCYDRCSYYAHGQYTWSSEEDVPDWDRWDGWRPSEEGPIDSNAWPPTQEAEAAPQLATAPAAPAGLPTSRGGGHEDRTSAGAFCDVCRHFVRGGRWAMRQHRLHSSRCLHRQGHMPAAREPCRYCGKPLAANDSWAQEQHRWHCPSAAPPSTVKERGSPPPKLL